MSRRTLVLAIPATALLMAGCASAPPIEQDVVEILEGRAIAEGTVFFPGTFAEGRQPDGNSVMLLGPDGWIVFDTGRHEAHGRRLLAYARASGRPATAIVNSHWHLDHASGNRLLRDAFPDADVFASDAIVAALPGFLAESRRRSETLIAAGGVQEPMRSELLGDIATITDAGALLPTETVTRSSLGTLAGRKVYLGLAEDAVTAGDLWLYDTTTRVLLAGDLVTLPVPFLDTACPAGWQDALGTLAGTDFTLLVPGHGEPMDRAAFNTWRVAFDGLLACAATDAAASTCGDGWISGLDALLPGDEHARARAMIDYYVDDVLRAPERSAAQACPAG